MRVWLRSAAAAVLVLVAAALAGCSGGGGGSSNFDFNGTWVFHETVTQNTGVPGFPPPGASGNEVIVITQSGTSITLSLPGNGALVGTCDPKARTFLVDYAVPGSRFIISGAGTGDSTMSGEMNFAVGSKFAKVLYTADKL